MKNRPVTTASRPRKTHPARPGKAAGQGRRKPVSRLPADRRITEIIAAARNLITEQGYEATSMLGIADRAGIAEGTLYRFFKTKQELMVRVAEAWLDELLREDLGLRSIQGTWNRLRHLIWRVLDLMHREPAVSRFVLIEMRPMRSYRSSRLFRLTRRFTEDIRSVCDDAISSGEFRKDVPAVLLRDMIFGCIEHQTWAYLRGEGEFRIDAVADGIAHVVYGGMLARPVEDANRMETVLNRLERVASALEQGNSPG